LGTDPLFMQPNLFDLSPPEHPEPPAAKIVVQHNALVNARFDLSTVEMRLFMAMLSRIGRDDDEFREMLVPITEVVALSGRRPSVKDYQQVEAMCDQLVSRVLHIERPAAGGRRRRGRKDGERDGATPDFDKLPLMAYAKYRGAEGALKVRFNDEVMPYLLQLQKNFTKAQVVQLLKLKSPHSYRIYWLLKEYATFGTRTLGVDELKSILSLDGQYKQFPLFKLRVLDKAQQELSRTDLPFEYELLRQGGKRVTHIRFTFQPLAVLPEAVLAAAEAAGEQLPEWHRQLLELGLAASSLDTLVELVEQAIVAPEYIAYVIRVQREKHKAGKLKSLPGAVFAAVTKRHLLAEFEAQRARVVPPSTRIIRSRPAALPRRDKLLNELEDAHTSLRFVRTATSYTEEARVIAVAEVEARIAQVEAQLRVVE
jgi:hypothetical protein